MTKYGLRTRDQAGNILLDTSSRLVRLYAIFTIYGAQSSLGQSFGAERSYWYTSPVIPGLADDGQWLVDVPACPHSVEFIGSGQFQIKFYFIFGRFSDIPVTIFKA